MVPESGYLLTVTRKPCTGGRRDPAPAGSRCHLGRDGGASGGQAFTPRIVVGDPHHASQSAVIYGDNARAMEYLLGARGIAGAVDLVYVDPPFKTGREFTGRDGQLGYSDIWPSEAAFLLFLRTRLRLLNELLSEQGSFYLHIDRKVGYRVRVLIDRTIGREHFRNEITRVKCNPKNSSRKAYGNQTDVIYFYSRPDAIWNDCREPLTEEQAAVQYEKVEAGTGRRYTTSALRAGNRQEGRDRNALARLDAAGGIALGAAAGRTRRSRPHPLVEHGEPS